MYRENRGKKLLRYKTLAQNQNEAFASGTAAVVIQDIVFPSQLGQSDGSRDKFAKIPPSGTLSLRQIRLEN